MPTRKQIEKGARAYDRWTLREQGWSEEQIDDAMSKCSPSTAGIQTATVILEAVETKH